MTPSLISGEKAKIINDFGGCFLVIIFAILSYIFGYIKSED
jgi:hypothetical protein